MSINSQQERIIGFLAQGLRPAQIATIVGCTPSYISQLLGDDGPEDFKSALQDKAKELSASDDVEEKTVSTKYLSMEHTLLKTIENRLNEAEFPALVNALKVVGDRQEKRAQRRAGLLAPQGANITQNIVNISVPAHALPEFRINGNLEVTAIGDRIMAPMSSAAVRQLFQDRKAPPVIMEQVIEQYEGSTLASLESEF